MPRPSLLTAALISLLLISSSAIAASPVLVFETSGFWVPDVTSPSSPPLSEDGDEVAYPLGGYPPRAIVVPHDVSISEEPIYCEACPVEVATCKHVYLTFSAGELYDLPADLGGYSLVSASPTGTLWLPDSQDGEISVVYHSDNLLASGLPTPSITVYDAYGGAALEYSVNAPGVVALVGDPSTMTLFVSEGEEVYVPFLGATLRFEYVGKDGMTIVVDGLTVISLHYSAAADGSVGEVYLYHDDLGGPRIFAPVEVDGDPVPMAFFVAVYRVSGSGKVAEVGITSPWMDARMFLRDDPDVPSQAEEEWPSTADDADYRWHLRVGDDGELYAVGYIEVDGAEEGPFAVKLEGLPPGTKGLVSYTFAGEGLPEWDGVDPAGLDGPYWYRITYLNATWVENSDLVLAGETYRFANVESDCSATNCTEWSAFGIFKVESDDLPIECGCIDECEVADELPVARIQGTSPFSTLANYTWDPGMDAPVKAIYPEGGGGEGEGEEGSEAEVEPSPPAFDAAACGLADEMMAGATLGFDCVSPEVDDVIALPPMSWLSLGGPLVNELSAEVLDAEGVSMFSRGGRLYLTIENAGVMWRVDGRDWAMRDYAVAMRVRDAEGRVIYVAAGLTRYGTSAAAQWIVSGEMTDPSFGYVLAWRDYDRQGDVDAWEVRVVARFRLPAEVVALG